MALLTNIVAYYKFDANNSNDSVSSNNGIDTDITYNSTAGKINNGASFNGSTSNISTPSGIYSLFQGTFSWTVNCWFKTTTTNTTQQAIFQSNASTSAFFKNAGIDFQLSQDISTKLSVLRGDGASIDVIDGSTVITANAWYMVTATYDGAHISLYVNGASENTPVASTRTVPTQGIGQIGCARSSSSTGQFANGYVDEIGWWSRALTGTEITQLYNGGAGFQYPFVASSAHGFLMFM